MQGLAEGDIIILFSPSLGVFWSFNPSNDILVYTSPPQSSTFPSSHPQKPLSIAGCRVLARGSIFAVVNPQVLVGETPCFASFFPHSSLLLLLAAPISSPFHCSFLPTQQTVYLLSVTCPPSFWLYLLSVFLSSPLGNQSNSQ